MPPKDKIYSSFQETTHPYDICYYDSKKRIELTDEQSHGAMEAVKVLRDMGCTEVFVKEVTEKELEIETIDKQITDLQRRRKELLNDIY